MGALMKMRAMAIVGALGVVAAGCGTTVRVKRLKPAEVNLAGFQKIAIGGVKGESGAHMSTELTAALASTGYFAVVDREHLAQVMAEQQLSVSDVVDETQSVEVGKLIGAAALLYGNMATHRYDESTQVQKDTCTRGSGKDKQEYTCYHHTRTGAAAVQAGFSVVDTSTGRVLASKSFNCNQSASTSATDGTPGPIDGNAMLTRCRAAILVDFMKVIAPYHVDVRVDLEEDGDLPDLERGNQFARRGDWGKAVEYYLKAVNMAEEKGLEDDEKAAAHYNLGVAYGYSGQYDKGVAQLQRAFDLHADEDWLDEMAKVKQFQADDAKLREQGVKTGGDAGTGTNE
jgi:curli biogenesis system outer membrane secretion channel CsgG